MRIPFLNGRYLIFTSRDFQSNITAGVVRRHSTKFIYQIKNASDVEKNEKITIVRHGLCNDQLM